MVEVAYQDANQVLSEIINRIRSLESKYNILGERLLIVNQNMISQLKRSSVETRTINDEVKELKIELEKAKESIRDSTRELQFFATKSDLKVLEKYINLWDPMKFVTNEELEKMLKIKRATRGRK